MVIHLCLDVVHDSLAGHASHLPPHLSTRHILHTYERPWEARTRHTWLRPLSRTQAACSLLAQKRWHIARVSTHIVRGVVGGLCSFEPASRVCYSPWTCSALAAHGRCIIQHPCHIVFTSTLLSVHRSVGAHHLEAWRLNPSLGSRRLYLSCFEKRTCTTHGIPELDLRGSSPKTST